MEFLFYQALTHKKLICFYYVNDENFALKFTELQEKIESPSRARYLFWFIPRVCPFETTPWAINKKSLRD